MASKYLPEHLAEEAVANAPGVGSVSVAKLVVAWPTMDSVFFFFQDIMKMHGGPLVIGCSRSRMFSSGSALMAVVIGCFGDKCFYLASIPCSGHRLLSEPDGQGIVQSARKVTCRVLRFIRSRLSPTTAGPLCNIVGS